GPVERQHLPRGQGEQAAQGDLGLTHRYRQLDLHLLYQVRSLAELRSLRARGQCGQIEPVHDGLSHSSPLVRRRVTCTARAPSTAPSCASATLPLLPTWSAHTLSRD